jgi:hypothetical protein
VLNYVTMLGIAGYYRAAVRPAENEKNGKIMNRKAEVWREALMNSTDDSGLSATK